MVMEEGTPLLPHKTEAPSRNRRNQIAAVAGVTLALLSTGCAAGFAGVALPSFIEPDSEIRASRDELSWIASIMTVGCIIGNFVGGVISDFFGRKKSIIFTSLVSLAGWIAIGSANGLPAILVGRALTGLATGLYSAPVQVYICEIVDPSIRGVAGALPSLTVAIGILTSFCLGSLLTWRILALTCSATPFIVMLYVFFLPESPVWLFSKGRDAEAAKSIEWLQSNNSPSKRDHQKLEKELRENAEKILEKKSSPKKSPSKFCQRSVLQPLLIGSLVFFFQQFSGIFPILSYATLIFRYSGNPFVNEYVETICVGVIRLLSTILALFLIKFLKRRTLLVISGSFMCLSNFVLGYYFYLWQIQNSDDDINNNGTFTTINFAQPQQSPVDPDDFVSIGFEWIPLACLLVFMAAFSIGYGIVPWFLMPELMAPDVRSLACSIAFTFGQICRVCTVKTFLNLVDLVGADGTFGIYGAISLLSVIFVVACVPETEAPATASPAMAPTHSVDSPEKHKYDGGTEEYEEKN